MGVENNEAIIATTWSSKDMDAVRKWINEQPEDHRELFVFIPTWINGKETVVLGPSGSKKGWPEDEKHGNLIESFKRFLETFKYPDDGSSPFDWIEVGYGEYGQKIIDGNCKNQYNDKEYAED